MRKIFALTIALFFALTIQAQTNKFTENYTTGIDIFNDFVQDSPEGIQFKDVNLGTNIYGMYSYRIPKSKISLAIGLGLGMHNLHSNGLLRDTSNISYFEAYPDKVNGVEVNYKTNKLQLTYLDIPAEIRFKSDKGFRLAVGIKAGYLISAHTKFRGDNPEGGRDIKIKESKLPNLEKWRFGPTFQIGYKWVNFTGYYSLSKVFVKTNGPEIYPISIGLALRPF